MAFSDLPPELLDLIGSFCTRATLRNFRRVSRACNAASEQYVHVRLNGHNGLRKTFGMAQIASMPKFASTCRELCLRGREAMQTRQDLFEHRVQTVLMNCANLNTITLVVATPFGPTGKRSGYDLITPLLAGLLKACMHARPDFSPLHLRAAGTTRLTDIASSLHLGFDWMARRLALKRFFERTESFTWIFRKAPPPSFDRTRTACLAEFLEHAVALKSLQLAGMLPLFEVVRNATFPHLTRLSITNMTVDGPFLVGFLLFHRALETVVLHWLDLDDGLWRDYFEALAANLPSLRKVVLAGLFESSGRGQPIDFGYRPMEVQSTMKDEERRNNTGEIFNDDYDADSNNELGRAVEQYLLYDGEVTECPIGPGDIPTSTNSSTT